MYLGRFLLANSNPRWRKIKIYSILSDLAKENNEAITETIANILDYGVEIKDVISYEEHSYLREVAVYIAYGGPLEDSLSPEIREKARQRSEDVCRTLIGMAM